jgi:hypothetical protein
MHRNPAGITHAPMLLSGSAASTPCDAVLADRMAEAATRRVSRCEDAHCSQQFKFGL